LEIGVRGRHWLAGVGALMIGAAGFLTSRSDAQPAELSFTAAQSASGEVEYKANCIDCHGAHLDDGEFGGPPLKGAAFSAKWFRLPASGLVNYIHAAMPPDAPGRLPMGTYVEITAYILNMNGVAPGTRDMPADIGALTALHYPTLKHGQ
jgi:mono/diheme cytochrome c family protein